MRILFSGLLGDSLPPPYGGIPKRALLLGRIWKQQGHEIGFVFQYRHDHEDDLGAGGNYFFEYDAKPTKLSKLRFLIRHGFLRPLQYVAYLRAAILIYPNVTREVVLYAAYAVFFEDMVRAYAPDVIIAETALVKSVFCGFVARKLGIPFVLETYAEIHDRSMMRFPNQKKRTQFWHAVLALSDLVIAPSEYCAQGPREFLPESKIKMIYATTLETERFVSVATPKSEIRTNFGIPQDAFCVLAVGAFTSRKGHDHIVKAVAKLRKQGKPVHVLLCGAGSSTWLETLAQDLGVADSLSCFHQLSEEELRLLFRTADLYCDASNTPRACLGIALTEALASSLPVLCYNAGGLPEVVEEGVNGFLVPLNDIDALARAIEKVYNMSADDRTRLGTAGLSRARQVFDINIVSHQIINAIESVAFKYEKN